MYHDPKPNRRRNWLSALFAEEEDQPVSAASVFAQPKPDPVPAAEASSVDETVLADLGRLAEQLADLIGSAQARLNGAVQLVDRSADQAAAYGRQLQDDADRISAAPLPPHMVEALIGITREMIERTQDAETRLRSTNDELRDLQEELQEAQETAERDPLTGLPNRRSLENALNRAIAAAQAANTALSVAFCDIDSFKRLNDVHGHAVGDRVLRVVADALADGASDDGMFVGRQGGEEFVMLFEGLTAIEAAARVDTIREGLAERTLRTRGSGTPIGTVTFSAGVAELQSGESAHDVLHRADSAMYRAKEGGRNQVVVDAGD